eukprot:scaffold151230_cov29-Tisochrysis_lutea.AAC.1
MMVGCGPGHEWPGSSSLHAPNPTLAPRSSTSFDPGRRGAHRFESRVFASVELCNSLGIDSPASTFVAALHAETVLFPCRCPCWVHLCHEIRCQKLPSHLRRGLHPMRWTAHSRGHWAMRSIPRHHGVEATLTGRCRYHAQRLRVAIRRGEEDAALQPEEIRSS